MKVVHRPRPELSHGSQRSEADYFLDCPRAGGSRHFGNLVPTLGLAAFAFWLVVIGFVVLAAGNMFEGL
ncbi:MAG: hypothetical protein V1755_12915 [Chloroflexota bacterium]